MFLEDILRIHKGLIAFLRPTKLKPSRASITDAVSIPKTLAIAFCTQIIAADLHVTAVLNV